MVGVCDQELRLALLNGRARPPRSFRQWITEELVIPSGRFEGERFDIETQPVLSLWIDAVDDPQWTDCVFQAVTQMGKTLFGFVAPMLWHTCEQAEDFILGVPFGDMASNKWDADILPVLMASPTLRKLRPVRGSGSGGGKVRDAVTLAHGATIKIMSAGSDDAGKAGFTARCFSITEAARFSQNGATSVETDPLRQLRGRQRSFPRADRRTYIEGTVTVETELPWRLRPDSTRSRILAECPHCGRWIAPDRDDLIGWREARTEVEAANVTHWRCPKCTTKITEPERRDMVRAAKLIHAGQRVEKGGRVVGSHPQSTRLFFHATPFVNLLLGPQDIGVEEWLAARIPPDTADRTQADRELSQFVWSQPYTEPVAEGEIELSRTSIATRMIALPRGVVPPDVVYLTLGVDMGESRSWFVLLASRTDGTLHVVDYGDFDVRSDLASPKVAMKAALKDFWETTVSAGWQVRDGDTILPHQSWVDAGHEETAVWEFVREVNTRQTLGQSVMAARGRGETQIGQEKFTPQKKTGNQVRQVDPAGAWYVEWVRRGRCFEIHWDADNCKVAAQHSLSIPTHASGAITLFAGTSRIHERFARHICAERRRPEHKPGQRPKWKFFRTGANHLLDALAEAYCAQMRLGYEPPELPEGLTDPVADDPATEPIRKPVSQPGKPVSKPGKQAKAAESPADDARKQKQKDWFAKIR